MCGIAGQYRIKKEQKLRRPDVKAMLDIIKHRGPDGEGMYESDDCIFGMRRLSIIDIESGWQPLYNEDKSIVCCANGEIYNYIELREELEELGHSFRTRSDIEVIPHLYEEYGEGFVNKLNGMFAISIWDSNAKRLLLYRDRLGKKPLYYGEFKGKLFFGSEIKSIIGCGDVTPECNFKALDYILSYNYIPNNMTSFRDIYKVMPGEYMVADERGITKDRYWSLRINWNHEGACDENIATQRVREIIDDAVKIRLRSDVPVGAFLSGGVDSSFIVGKAAQSLEKLNTFSIGFNEARFDESQYSDQVAELFNTNHTKKYVDDSFFPLLPKTIWYCDDPHGDVSFMPLFVLAQMTAEHMKTVLTGDGGDELFGGYDKYLKYIEDGCPDAVSFFENNSVFSVEEKEKLYSDRLKAEIGDEDCLNYVREVLHEAGIDEDADNADRLNILLFLETKLLLEGNNLVKPDRMGMGNSLEARCPLLDYRLVEYVSSLPSELKVRDGITKYIFKKVASEILPEDIVYRKKQMFTVPIGEWFKGALKEEAYEILLGEEARSRGLFNLDYVRYMLDEHVAGRANYTRQIRLLIVIEYWYRVFIDGEKIRTLKIP